MRRIFATFLVAMSAAPAFAGSLDVTAPATLQTLAAIAPAAQKVYPPLPTLAMLPQTIGDDDDAPAVKSVAKKGRKPRHAIADCRCSAPEPRLVVSDDSRAYLKDVDARLDASLARVQAH